MKQIFPIPMLLIIFEVYFIFTNWCDVLGRYAMELTNPQPSIFFYLSISEAYLDNVSTFELTQLPTHFQIWRADSRACKRGPYLVSVAILFYILEPTVMAASVIQRSKLWEVQVLLWG